jgi:hypothetical protein
MVSTSKSPSPIPAVPPWARFFSRRELAELWRLIAAELEARDLDVPLRSSCSTLVLPGGGELLDLAALARTCNEHPMRRWPAIVAGLFDRLLAARLDLRALLARLDDLDAVRARIKVRIHGAPPSAPRRSPRLSLRPLAEGLVALLVCDLDVANVAVPRDVVARWGVPRAALWSLAIENLRAERRLRVVRGPVKGRRAVDMLAGETPFATSHLLFFEDYFAENPRYGALVALPQRHVILRHVIRDASLLEVVPFLRATTLDAYERGPGATSTQIYWWRPGGTLELLPVREVGGSVLVRPSRELQREVLDPILRGAAMR